MEQIGEVSNLENKFLYYKVLRKMGTSTHFPQRQPVITVVLLQERSNVLTLLQPHVGILLTRWQKLWVVLRNKSRPKNQMKSIYSIIFVVDIIQTIKHIDSMKATAATHSKPKSANFTLCVGWPKPFFAISLFYWPSNKIA